jgi:hypothetical protein
LFADAGLVELTGFADGQARGLHLGRRNDFGTHKHRFGRLL